MKKSFRKFIFLNLGLFAGLIYADTEAIKHAISEGTTSLNLRLGYEYSSTDDNRSPGKALSLRSRIGYRTENFYDTKVFVEFHSLVNMMEEFEFPGGNRKDRDFISDPDGERLHQGYVEYFGFPYLELKLGRQEIQLDDERFIGNVNWRQNGQSFDGLTLFAQPTSEIYLYAALLNQVNTITLSHVDLEHLILLHLKYVNEEIHKFHVFSYLVDDEFDQNDSITYGVKVDGLCGDILKYGFTFAYQDDYQGSHNRNADLIKITLGILLDPFNFGFGFSRISGKDGKDAPFDTLYSTAHKFNGWADQFAGTNGGNVFGGVEDFYVEFETEYFNTKFLMRYHLFDTTEKGSLMNNGNPIHEGTYGTELDFDLSRQINENLSAQITAAFYNENFDNGGLNPTTDEEVFWARLFYNF